MVSLISILIVCFILILIVFPLIRNKIYKEENNIIVEEEYNYGRLLVFNLLNKSDGQLELDLCQLNKNDNRYEFETSDKDYDKLVNYLKSYSLNVASTKVIYDNSDWQKDIIKLNIYNPFENIKTPIYIAMDDFMLKYAKKNVIESRQKYNFNYFSSLLVKLKPKESKQVYLFVVENEQQNEEYPVKCGVILKNNTSEVKRIKLFDEDNYNSIEGVEFSSLFDINTYQELIMYYKRNHLVAKELRMYSKTIKSVKYKLNFDDYDIKSPSEDEGHYYIIDLESDRYVAYFEVDVEPYSEIIITFK